MSVFEICFLVAVLGQLTSGDKPPTVDNSPEERLAYMQDSGRSYAVVDDKRRLVKFREEPILRWTNPVSGVVDGGLFLWESQDGRPLAAAQIFIAPGTDDLWIHEFQSLALGPLRFEYQNQPTWTPEAAGIELKRLRNAPTPAASAGARLSQMRQIARRFSVTDDFEGATSDPLRLMSSPLARYQDATATDRALFVFAHGTDPELLVLVEARRDADGGTTKWHAGLAPMTSYAVEAELDEEPYWSVERRDAPHPVTAIFKNYVFPPTP